MKLWNSSNIFFFGIVWKTRRKDKDSTQSSQDEHKLYLEQAVLERKLPDTDFKQFVQLAEGLDYNEWLASHTIAFFDHINLIYGTISEFCTMSGCSDMVGPANRQYLWFDEKGKKCKVAAPQYIDFVMTFIQKTINDESIFPIKFANEFPSSFESIVRKILRLLFHVLAHVYHAHFREILLLNLHAHLNCIYAHFITFNDCFHLVEDKEIEILEDLAIALKLRPRVEKPVSEKCEEVSEKNADCSCDKTISDINEPTKDIPEKIVRPSSNPVLHIGDASGLSAFTQVNACAAIGTGFFETKLTSPPVSLASPQKLQ